MTIDDNAPASKPARRRVLVVEDEYLVAMLVEEMLEGLGYEVAQVAATLEAALTAAQNSAIDVAVLDVNLSGKHSGPVAEALAARGIPFAFATGYGAAGLEGRYADAPTLQKPFYEDDLKRVLAALIERA